MLFIFDLMVCTVNSGQFNKMGNKEKKIDRHTKY